MGRGSDVELWKDIRFPHSLGLLYSALTAYLGFTVNNSEYKVMGLSAYGRMDRAANPYYGRLKQVIEIKPDGSYRLDMGYFTFQHSDRMPAESLCRLLDGTVRSPDAELLPRHKDVAAALQMITEDVVLSMLRHARKETGCPNAVLSGGVALNSVCNGRILGNTGFTNLWIQPNAGDAGNSMGAALFAHAKVLARPRVYRLDSAYLGPEFTDEAIGRFLAEGLKIVIHHHLETDTVPAAILCHRKGLLRFGPRDGRVRCPFSHCRQRGSTTTSNLIHVQGAEVVHIPDLEIVLVCRWVRHVLPKKQPVHDITKQQREVRCGHGFSEVECRTSALENLLEHRSHFQNSGIPAFASFGNLLAAGGM